MYISPQKINDVLEKPKKADTKDLQLVQDIWTSEYKYGHFEDSKFWDFLRTQFYKMQKELNNRNTKTYILYNLYDTNWNTWNGKHNLKGGYYMVEKLQKKNNVEEGCYHYNFGDGWALNIEVSYISKYDANKYRKESNGFRGYGWMVESIKNHGKIISQ